MHALNRSAGLRWLVGGCVVGLACLTRFAGAQEGPQPVPLDEAAQRAEAALADEPADDAAPAQAAPQDEVRPQAPPMNLWKMTVAGGPLMIPIFATSIIAGVFALERALALRRRKVVPPGFVQALGQLSDRPGGLDPRAAYRACQQYPSTVANVLKSVLLKVGRPHSEVEHAVKEACDREATKLYRNVRPLNLATTIAPLLGLLGTVQGMIMAFYVTSYLAPGADKSRELSEGIYIAMVTTFAGLTVAIPCQIAAHWFEGRIQNAFHEIDELLFGLLPQFERFEGKLRLQQEGGEGAPGPDRGRDGPGDGERKSSGTARAK